MLHSGACPWGAEETGHTHRRMHMQSPHVHQAHSADACSPAGAVSGPGGAYATGPGSGGHSLWQGLGCASPRASSEIQRPGGTGGTLAPAGPGSTSSGSAAVGGSTAQELLEDAVAALAAEDASFLAWAESGAGRAAVAGELRGLRARAAAAMVSQVGGTCVQGRVLVLSGRLCRRRVGRVARAAFAWQVLVTPNEPCPHLS